MQLIYYRGRQMNFGDDLNAVLWPHLLPRLLDGLGHEGMLGIGTLIGRDFSDVSHLHVFSSGAGYDPIDTWAAARTIWCVRGPISAQLLGAPADTALTDGAILTPEFFGPPPLRDDTGRAVGVVPHWESLHFPGWQAACDLAGYQLISPIDTPQSVYAKLGSVSLVLTESLHGAILADTMGIPWLPLATTRNVSALKWVDWSMSVGLAFAPLPIPPPSAAAALAFGRPGFGPRRVTLDAQAAMAEFRSRVARAALPRNAISPGMRLKHVMRDVSQRSPLVSRLLGFSPERTAEALVDAARQDPSLSLEPTRAALRTRMLDRLLAFERAQTPVRTYAGAAG